MESLERWLGWACEEENKGNFKQANEWFKLALYAERWWGLKGGTR